MIRIFYTYAFNYGALFIRRLSDISEDKLINTAYKFEKEYFDLIEKVKI
ncbi:hypothetical protein UT300007_08650 [Clostridium sp. CTA-7]